MATRKPQSKVSPSTFRRRLKKQRELAFWDWTLDLSQVKTKADFVALVKEHVRERVRAGFIKEFRLQAGARFWHQLNWELGCYFGNIRVRILGWDQFEKRQKEYAAKLQTHFRQLRQERGAAGFKVEYDKEPVSPVRFRTFIRYFLLGPQCKLTIPALAAALRANDGPGTVAVLVTKRPELEFDFGLEGTRRLTNKDVIELDFGGYRLHLVVNHAPKQAALLRQYLADNYPDHDEQLERCKSVLELWSWDDDPTGRFGKQRQAVLDCVQQQFRDLYLEEDDPLGE